MIETPVYTEKPWPWVRNALMIGLEQHRPHTSYGVGEVDVTDSLLALSRCRRAVGMAVSLHSFVLYCLAKAASEHPAIQTFRKGNRLITFDDVDVSTVIEKKLPNHVRIPVGKTFRKSDKRSLADINWDLRQAGKKDDLATDPEVILRRRVAKLPTLARKAIGKKIGSDPFWIRKYYGTVGLTNLQSQGFQRPFAPMPPNIFTYTLAVGTLTERFLPDADGKPVLRKMLCLGAGADHAVIDGVDLSRFARRLTELLETAAGLDDTFIEETRRLMNEEVTV